MISTIIKQNNYQDSINLMLLTNYLSTVDGIIKAQVMMGTEANKEIMNQANLLTDEAKKASHSDMIIVFESSNDLKEVVLEKIESFLNNLSRKSENTDLKIGSWKKVKEVFKDANLAIISTPGIYAPLEIENALDNGLNVFVFSDNVDINEEKRLKEKAHKKGLLMMGPDCGTAIFQNIPIAFANNVSKGNIGIVGASGTGIQEISTLIDKFGGKISHAIGTGGRDLRKEIGAITSKDALIALDNDINTKVIVFVSKPADENVSCYIKNILESLSKKVVAIFLGEKPKIQGSNVYYAYTLEEAAKIATNISKNMNSQYNLDKPEIEYDVKLKNKKLKGLYSGGTLAYEASILIKDAMNLKDEKYADGYILKNDSFEIIDLGDDIYTKGKPHPMIDPTLRIELLEKYINDKSIGVILLDIVLGYGSSLDAPKKIANAIKKIKEKNKDVYIIGSVCGTDKDIQGYYNTKKMLEDSGMIIKESNFRAVRYALNLFGKDIKLEKLKIAENKKEKIILEKSSKNIQNLLNNPLKVVNIGIENFKNDLKSFGVDVIQYDFKPIAGGNKKLINIIKKIKEKKDLEKENLLVVKDFKDSTPFLVDVKLAYEVIEELREEKVLLHAGPKIEYKDMTGPMKGSCIGAILFEKWADNEKEAIKLLESNKIKFIPCHHVNAVGPMGGITSKNMPVFVVKNKLKNNYAYCNINEGIGKVLRFGAYSNEVIERLIWMKDTLKVVLSEALKETKDGINLNFIVAKAITMGDEFHQRNISASLIFLKEITPLILKTNVDDNKKRQVIEFLAKTDQFFLNLMMAAAKSIVDAARMNTIGTIVTTMCRNGKDFGIRVSGLKDEWFTGPANTPKGLFFTGFSQEDANTDIGDSAITETIGVGGMAMVAAPGVTRFVGAGGFIDALSITEKMNEITVSNNPNFTIPTWDFKGVPLGIDIVKVVETGILPIINTGIAHKQAGIGQIGAGTVTPPMECFEKALISYAKSIGIDTGEND